MTHSAGTRAITCPWVAPRDGRRIATRTAAGSLAAASAVVVPWMAMRGGLAARPWLARIDPADAFTYLAANHVALAFWAVAIMVVVARPLARWGVAVGDIRVTLRRVAIAVPVLAALAFGFDAAPFLVSGTTPALPFQPTPAAIAGLLAFQWLVVGFGEELLYRGLVHGLLRRALPGRLGVRAVSVSLAAVLSAAVFALAHGVYYGGGSFLAVTFDPSWPQLAWTFAFGVYLATLRERTGSLVGPIVLHNAANGLVLTMTLFAAAAIRP